MPAVLSLTDGDNTIDLQGAGSYAALDSYSFAPPVLNAVITAGKVSNISPDSRTISLTLRIKSASLSGLIADTRALERMLALASERQLLEGDSSTKVTLSYSLGTGDTISIDVLFGSWTPGQRVIDPTYLKDFVELGTLRLVCEPYGRLPTVVLGRKLLHAEVDGTNINHVDIGDGWGGHFKFDGADTLIAGGSDASIDDVFDGGGYLRMRARLNSEGEGNAYLILKGDDSTTGFRVHVSAATSLGVKLNFRFNFSGGDGTWRTDDVVLFFGRFDIIEIGYNADSVGNQPIFKVNGTVVAITRLTTPTGTRGSDAASNLTLGNLPDASTTTDGDISELALYDADSISDSITKQLSGTESNLVLLWGFEEGSGATVRDNSSNSNNGTITPGTGSWGVDPTLGNAGALLRVRIEDEASNPWETDKKLYIATRSGNGRADVLFDDIPDSIVEGTEPSSVSSTFTSGITGGRTGNSSGGTSAFMRWESDGSHGWIIGRIDLGYAVYNLPATIPKGIYRALVRFEIDTDIPAPFDITDLALAMGWSGGGITKTPVRADDVAFPDIEDTWLLFDVGQVTLPLIAMPTGFTEPSTALRVHAISNLTSPASWAEFDFLKLSFDYLFLFPITEGNVSVDDVSPTDEILIDNIGTVPGVWILNTSSVVQEIPVYRGDPIIIGLEATRLYWMKDGDNDPSLTQAFVYIEYDPLVIGF